MTEPADFDEIVMTPEQAISIVAQEVLWSATTNDDIAEWEDYPELSEEDWVAVMDAVSGFCPNPPLAKYQAAYALLKARADHDH